MKRIIYLGLISLLLIVGVNLEAQATSNLEKGEELYLQARELFFNPIDEDESIKEAVSLLKESRDNFKQVNDDYQSYYGQGKVEFLLAEIRESLAEERKAAVGFQQAERFAEQALRVEATAKAHTLLADSYMRQFDYRGNMYVMQYGPRSLELLQRAVRMDSNNYHGLNSLANYYYFAPEIGGGSKNKAVHNFEQVIKGDDEQQRFIAYIWLGVISREENNDLVKAEEYFKQALEIYPNSKWAKAELKGEGGDYGGDYQSQ